jgi:hypothetical protein
MNDFFVEPPAPVMSKGAFQRRREHLLSELERPAPRRLRPREFAAGWLQQLKGQLVPSIQVGSALPRQRRPRRVLVGAVAVATAGVLAAAAYAGYALTQPATQLQSIGCYESDSLDADTAVAAPGVSPVATCAAMWASAFPNSQQPASFSACVLQSGAVGVFPSDATSDTCKSLGLASLDQTSSAQQALRKFADVKQSLVAAFARTACLNYGNARASVRTALDRHGLSNWRIQEGEGAHGEGFSSQRPCAGLAFDAAHQTIILVPEAH